MDHGDAGGKLEVTILRPFQRTTRYMHQVQERDGIDVTPVTLSGIGRRPPSPATTAEQLVKI